jgi:recombination protein RecA
MKTELSKLLDSIKKKNPLMVRDAQEAGNPKRIQMDSPQLNYAFGGSFVIGKIYNFFGPFSGGKSSIAYYIAGQLQKKMPESQQIVIYVDFERSFISKHAEEIGLNCTSVENGGKLLYLSPDTLEDLSDSLEAMVKTHEIACIIIDSESAAPTKVMMTSEASKANFGAGAKALGEFLKKYNVLCSNYDTSMIIISQERANMNAMSHLPGQTGGYALPYYASYRARITKVDLLKNAEDTIGQQIRFRCYKSKIGIPFRDGEVNLLYKGGFNADDEYMDFLIKFDIFKQGGAWYSNEEYGVKLNGRTKIKEWLNENPEAFTKMKQQVDDLLSRKTVLDENNEDPDIAPPEEVITEDILEENGQD